MTASGVFGRRNLGFCHLANNYGFTGGWFINDIRDLEPSPALRWFKHCFAPSVVFIDLTDRRYTKHLEPLKPDSDLVFNLIGVNDLNRESSGKAPMKLLGEKGTIISTQEESTVIESFGKRLQPCFLKLLSKVGGCLLIAEYHEKGGAKPVLSRRYLKVGDAVTSFKDYFEYTLNWLGQLLYPISYGDTPRERCRGECYPFFGNTQSPTNQKVMLGILFKPLNSNNL